MSGVFLGLDPSPRRTDNESICMEGLHLKEILVDECEFICIFLIDFHVLLKHFDFILVDIIDNIFGKVIAEMDGDPSYATERLKDLVDLLVLEPFGKIEGDWFRNGRVPALLIDAYSLLKLRK